MASSTINPLDLYSKNQLCSISANMWSRPATALLIEIYRKYECLWKTNCIYYRNKKKRHDALQEIATAVIPFRPDTTVEDVKNKINGIRTQYVAEKNKIAHYAKQNPPMEYESTLWCYDRLSFLASYTSLKNKAAEENTSLVGTYENPTSNKKQIKTEDEDIENITENEECDSSQQPEQYLNMEPSSKRAKVAKHQSDFTEVTCTSAGSEIMPTKSQHKASEGEWSENTESNDWIEVFGKFVTTQMKLITNRTLLIKLQHTLQSAIMDAQLKQIELDKKH